MTIEELRWKRNSTLKEMMDSYNSLLDEMERMSAEIESLATVTSDQHHQMADKFHELNDRILTVNFKTDEMKQDINDKLDDILRRIERNHPGS